MKKQKVQAKINLETLAGGAFAEKLNEALMQVAENIQNPNTDAADKAEPIKATTLTSLVDYIKESREELRDRMII